LTILRYYVIIPITKGGDKMEYRKLSPEEKQKIKDETLQKYFRCEDGEEKELLKIELHIMLGIGEQRCLI